MRTGRLAVYFFFFIFTLSACNSVPDNKEKILDEDKGTPEISFNVMEYDFGRITEGEVVAYTFKYRNTGDGKLLINSATTSCGCTVPRFDKKPLEPGDEGSMEVIFDSSHREGKQTKTITVRSNAKVKVVVLRITAEIINKES